MVYVIFLLPVIIILIGYLMNRYPPKKINWFVGYRTRKSMEDENVWKTANKYCGALWVKLGLIMFVISLILYILFHLKVIALSEEGFAIIVLCQILPIFLSGILVEKKIKDINK